MTELFDFAAHAAIKTNEQRIMAAVESIEKLLKDHFDVDAERPQVAPVAPKAPVKGRK